MLIRSVTVTSRFERQYKKLPKTVRETAKEKETIFRINPFDASLDTHKLHGKEKTAYAFSVNLRYRIKFVFLEERSVLFLEIGTHGIYK